MAVQVVAVAGDIRFDAKWREDPGSGCWNWTAYRSRKGRGMFKLGGRMRWAHRVAYERWVGPIPDGQVVRHRCDNPGCVNPQHLELGTQADNVRDRVERGRCARGAAMGAAKLCDRRVRLIRALSARGELRRDVARHFGVDPSVVSNVVHRKAWSHVD